MTYQILPYFLLLISILVGWKSTIRNSLIILAIAIISGLFLGRLEPFSLIGITILGLSIWIATKQNQNKYLIMLSYAIFISIALLHFLHLMPGFYNLPIYQAERLSETAIPFTMYLNFDKVLVGLFIYLFFLKTRESNHFDSKNFKTTLIVLGGLLVFMIPLAILIQYIKWDVKLPEKGWIWFLNNLFFVCLAEEALFRGLIQKGLMNLLPKKQTYWKYASLMIASILFGLAHYRGGFSYIALATVAGIFYGYSYYKTDRIESPILVHFGLNLVHFVFFTYPALA